MGSTARTAAPLAPVPHVDRHFAPAHCSKKAPVAMGKTGVTHDVKVRGHRSYHTPSPSLTIRS